MKVKELKQLLNGLSDNAEVNVIDKEQDNCYTLLEGRTCEDSESLYYKSYIDLVIERF